MTLPTAAPSTVIRSTAASERVSLAPWILTTLLILCQMASPSFSEGQVRPDSTRIVPDSMEIFTPEDSLALQEAPGDTINPADTLPAVIPPEFARILPEGWHTGLWEWDREEILASKAVTLAELLEEIPGTVPLRGGDYGLPVAVSVFGAGGGRIKVFRDGIEVVPLEGSVVDLARIGLAGLRAIRVVRAVGELEIHVESVLAEGGRPYSLVEAGTGDLNTNVFRGTFSHPRALGGVVALTMERVDTRGPRGQEPGISQGAWIRYARGLTEKGSIFVDFASRSADRGEVFSPRNASRSDWSLRTRWDLMPGLVGDFYYSSSSLKTDEDESFDFELESRTQLGAILTYEAPWIRALARVKRQSGVGIPGTSAHIQAQGDVGRFGGVSGEMTLEKWDGRTINRNRLRAWTQPVWGFSLFAEMGSGEWGLPYLPPLTQPGNLVQDPAPVDSLPGSIDGPRFNNQTGTRFGAQFDWKGFSLSGAMVETESDSLFFLGLPSDRSVVDQPGMTQAGGSRTGFEVAARIPLYPKGFSLVGWWQKWDQAEDIWVAAQDSTGAPQLLTGGDAPWRYMPNQSYQAALSFHDTFKPTGNLEVWFDLGARGRDPMALPFANTDEDVLASLAGLEAEETPFVPSVAPFYQSWYVRLQIRIVTVRAFIMWENFTLRQQNQDYLGRVLPASRSLYGVRWTLWN